MARIAWIKKGRGYYETADAAWRILRQDSGRWELHQLRYGGTNYVTTKDTLKAAKERVGLYNLTPTRYEGDGTFPTPTASPVAGKP